MACFIWCLAACTPGPDAGWGITLDPEPVWVEGRLHVDTPIGLELSPAAVEALEHGVALVLVTATRVSRRTGPVDRLQQAREYRMELKYLPLSRHWQLRDLESGGVQNFPRRWMLHRALAEEVRRFDTGLERARLDAGSWHVRVRVHLDRNALPAPMHLPAWLSPEWRIASGWHGRDLDGGSGPPPVSRNAG